MKLTRIILQIQMFNPNQFLRGNTAQQDQRPPQRPPGRIILEKMTDLSKTRWDEPIQVPDVLYLKFKVPPPSATAPSPARQPKKYPLSLIDYIKRAYGKCRDEVQSRAMQAELKKIIGKYEENLEAVGWENVPLPNLQEQRRPPSTLATISSLRDISIKKESTVPAQKEERMVVKEEAPPQAKMKVQSTLQKLQEKLSKKEEGRVEEKKTFIGFKNESDTYKPPPIRSEISPHLRTMFANNSLLPPPPPPPPPPSTQNTTPTASTKPKKQITDAFSVPSAHVASSSNHAPSKSKDIFDRFVKSSERAQRSQILNVVTSTLPEPLPLPSDKRRHSNKSETSLPQSSKMAPPFPAKQKQKQKVIISRKELTQIAKAAQNHDLYNVAKRYQQFNRLKPQTIRSIEDEDEDVQGCEQIIVGRSTCIDKPYLRITGRPDADTVRPEPILKLALAHFLREHKQATTPYDLLISQLKSIRQDLTVQHIRNSFTVQVYQENFKMSLFENDIIQVKYCQANLWQLYRQGLKNTVETRHVFISYHLMTLVLEEKDVELEYMLTLLPEGTLNHHAVRDSLRLKKIFLLGNYRAFFDFYSARDEISRKLLNIYIDKVRIRCLVMFSKTCGERMTFNLLSETVGEDEDVLEALAVGEGAVVRQGFFMLKQSFQKLSKSDFLVIKKVTNLLI